MRRSNSGAEDELGNEIPGETIVAAVCEIQQRQRSEHDDAVAEGDWAAYFLPGTVLRSGDKVIVDEGEFEVIGDPWPARDPELQADSHVEASLKRTAGPEDGS